MQLFVIALVLGIFLHDGYPQRGDDVDAQLTVSLLAISLLPKLAVALLYYAQCAYTRRNLGTPRGRRLMLWLDRTSTAYRWVVLMLYAQDLARVTPLDAIGLGLDQPIDLLAAIRNALEPVFGPEVVLIDEILIMLPPLAMMVFAWWAFYPIDRQMRESAMMREVDRGLPVYPIWSRGQYLLSQARHQLALMLVPMLVLITMMDVMNLPRVTAWLDQWNLPAHTDGLVLTVGAAGVFLFAPLMIRMIWDTTPLPDGELRRMLVNMCRRHRVGVRQLLLWRTFGGMINAAVIGVLAPLRYILLTDALLDNMPKTHVEAVMAHEIAHVRRHHMFWLILAAVVLIEAPAMVLQMAIAGLAQLAGLSMDDGAQTIELIAAVATVALWIVLFGWVSRRFERQADTFAVQHLTQTLPPADETDPSTGDANDPPIGAAQSGEARYVTAVAVETMVGALQQVAVLNHIPEKKKSWRHGSIHWRQAYLRSLVGRPVDALSIDATIRHINLASAAVAMLLAAAAAALFFLAR